MKGRVAVLAALVAVLLLAAGLAPVSAREPEEGIEPGQQEVALVQIKWPESAERAQALATVEVAGVPVYARLSGEAGSYLLAGAAPGAVAALRAEGLAVTVLDADMAGARYYLVYAMPDQDAPVWPDYGRLLLDDGVQGLLRASPESVAELAQTGFRVRALTLVPKPLRPTAAERVVPLVVTPTPLVQSIMDQVDTTTLYAYTGDLSGEWPVTVEGGRYTIATRYTYSGIPIQKATKYAGEHLEALGLDVEYHTWVTGYPPNVIGELPGENNPEEILIICGHIDSTSGNPYQAAPGADDNASGSVAVMAAADILSQYRWDCTLRFALWTGEEQGLWGSHAYAQRAYNDGEEILGVLNLDMISWNTPESNPTIDLHASQSEVLESVQLAQLFANVVAAYDLDLVPEVITNGTGASDHASFWDYGYTAILGIEDFSDFNPYYHSEQDQLETLDMDYFTEFTKASLATFAHMGCLLPHGTLSGQVTDAEVRAPISGATVKMRDTTGYLYSTTTDTTGHYSQTMLAETYAVTVTVQGSAPMSATNVVVAADAMTTLDFALEPAASLALEPGMVDRSVKPHELVTETVWVTNTGKAELQFTMLEMEVSRGTGGDVAWLAAQPAGGTLSPGAGMPVAVQLGALWLGPGTYLAHLDVESNDPLLPQVRVPVTLTVAFDPSMRTLYLPLIMRQG